MKIIIETERLQLHQLTADDNKYLLPITQQKEVKEFVSLEDFFAPMNSESEYVKHMLENFMESYKNNGFGPWGVVDKKTNKLIGWCGLHKMESSKEGDDEELIELAYTLDKNFWGKGLASEAAIAVINYAFDNLQLPYIVSCIAHKNARSINVAKKVGMKYWKDGEFYKIPCQIYKIEK